MTRVLRPTGTNGPAARLVGADFCGRLREGADFHLRGSYTALESGDLVIFFRPGGVTPGITVDEDETGLYASIQVGPAVTLRVGLEALGSGSYAFRFGDHHQALWPQLTQDGVGVEIS